MKLRATVVIVILLLLTTSYAQTKPESAVPRTAPLVATGTVPLAGVGGRIDHFSYDPKGRLFVSALGNNTIEVIDLSAGMVVHTITGVPHPQGVAYVPDFNKLFAASDEGKLFIYDAASYKLITSIDFHGDADNLRYDAATRRVYVGFGEDKDGAIGMVDASNNRRLPEEFKVGGHPESFQLETSGANIYVNVPDLKQIAVINRSTGAIARWPLSMESNFPMALDELDHRLFVATRAPARLLVLDTNTGHVVMTLPCPQDSDDLYYDALRHRIYVVGGEGYVGVFEQTNPDQYRLLAKIPSALGARTAGYFGKGHKGFDRFYVAVPARPRRGAEIRVYTVQE